MSLSCLDEEDCASAETYSAPASSSAALIAASSVFQRSSWKFDQLTPTVGPSCASAAPPSAPPSAVVASAAAMMGRLMGILSLGSRIRGGSRARRRRGGTLAQTAGVGKRKTAGRARRQGRKTAAPAEARAEGLASGVAGHRRVPAHGPARGTAEDSGRLRATGPGGIVGALAGGPSMPDRLPPWRRPTRSSSGRATRSSAALTLAALCAAGWALADPAGPAASLAEPAPPSAGVPPAAVGSHPVATGSHPVAAGPPAAAVAPRFETVSLPRHVYDGGWEHFVGGGVAALDCDGDRLPEIVAAGGSNPAVLLRNRGGMRFEEATPEALALTDVTGAYPVDLDGDGRLDLAVLRVGENALLRGGPGCAFAPFEDGPFADPRLAGGDRWTTAFSATWEAGRDLPTLAFGHYVDRADPEGPFEACDDLLLFRPEGDRYGAPLALPGRCALSMLFTDWGRRGRADLRVSNDRQYYVRDGQEELWAMEPVPRPYAEAEGWRRYELWGMGIASRDLSGDGLPEVYLTSMGDQRLQALEPGAAGPSYADAPFERGATAHRPHAGGDGRPSTGWHPAFGDVDLDGRDDLFVSKGNVEQMPGLAMDDPDSLLMQRADGTFRERSVEAGVASTARGRGAALADLDLDGRLDLVVAQRRAPMLAYRNVTEAPGAWLGIALSQPGPNRNAVGAWIEVEADGRRWSREVTVGGGHAGGVAGPEHFGLGEAQEARARVIWPDGVASDWAALEPGRYATLRRGEGSALTVEGW